MNINFPPILMNEKNAFDLICSRKPRPQIPPKPVKKIKNQNKNNKQDDALYKILSWRNSFQTYLKPLENTYNIRQTQSIVYDDESQWGSKFQGIFVDVDWQTQNIQQFVSTLLMQRKLKFNDQLIDNGIIFIWMPKNYIGEIMDYFAEKGFIYVENFIFTLLNRKKIPKKKNKPKTKYSINYYFKNISSKQKEQQKMENQEDNICNKDYQTGVIDDPRSIFLNQPSEYLLGSQKILFLFRKSKKNQSLQLRHQRTSDAFFTIGDDSKLDWKSKQKVYQMIQTLLIQANYCKNNPLKLLQLWGNQKFPRKGWVTVCEVTKTQINL